MTNLKFYFSSNFKNPIELIVVCDIIFTLSFEFCTKSFFDFKTRVLTNLGLALLAVRHWTACALKILDWLHLEMTKY